LPACARKVRENSGMQQSYSQQELDSIVLKVSPRLGWDFSRMADWRAPVPWEYSDVVAAHVKSDDDVLDIGTGGGEMFLSFATGIGSGVGIDIDPQMVAVATQNGRWIQNVSFGRSSHRLENVSEKFDVILNRHAPFALEALPSHLKTNGYFVTQQVGERNMANVKSALGQAAPPAPISREPFDGSGLQLVEFREYDVEYIVKDAESLVFWLSALDVLHADVDGSAALADVDAFNAILEGNVTDNRFVTNEHRYLAIAQSQNATPSSAAADRLDVRSLSGGYVEDSFGHGRP